MRIFSPEAVPPAAPDELAAAVVVPAALELAADVVPELDEELVQAVRARAPAAITASERGTGRRGVVRRDVDDIFRRLRGDERWAVRGARRRGRRRARAGENAGAGVRSAQPLRDR